MLLDEASGGPTKSDDQIGRSLSVERREIINKFGVSSIVAIHRRDEGMFLNFNRPGRLSAQLIADLPAPYRPRLEIPVIRMKDDEFFWLSGSVIRLGLSGSREAIRRLVEIGLSKSSSSKKPRVLSTAKEGAERAVELANDVIGKQMPNTSEEEKATRRRRLLKGPSEFRNVRRDHELFIHPQAGRARPKGPKQP